MDSIINLNLLKNPLNWIIVLLMVILAGAAGHFALSWLGVEPATASTSTSS